MKQLSIGSLRLKSSVVVAPMVDVTDLPYRLLCKKAGAGITYTEMLNIGSILHDNDKTLRMLKTVRSEKPVGIQITGRNVEEFKTVAGREELRRFDLVDINCGCPSLRITGNSSGSYLLRNPTMIGDMIRVLRDEGHVVTAKIRLGFRKNNVLRVAKAVEKAGADALTIHARLANEGGRVPARWSEIARVKKQIGIPVIGNGDVTSGAEAEKLLEVCDGVMIARAAIGDPLIFRNVNHHLRTGKEKVTESKERLEQFRTYLKLAEKYDVIELSRIKYLGGHFLKGFEGAAQARMEFVRLKDYPSIRRYIETFKNT